MRIAYITSFFPPERMAGAELGTHFMAKCMAECGHEVHVLVTRPDDNKYRSEERCGYRIHWMPYVNIKGLRFFSEIRASSILLDKIKPDLIHANCLLPGGIMATRVGSKLGIPSVILCYGYDVCDMKSWQARIYGTPALEKSTKVLAATEYCKEVIHARYTSREVTTFYAGYDDSVFPERPYHQANENKKLIFIGRLIEEKDPLFLVEVMQGLPKSYSLQIYGQGALKAELLKKIEQKKLSDRIELKGGVANHELCEILAKSDCLILPSRREPFGVVCIEAIACGTPVVCSEVMGLPEAVRHERNGFVLKSREAQKWQKSILRCCEDEDFRMSIYENSLEDRKKWAWSTRLLELKGIYEEVLRGKRNG